MNAFILLIRDTLTQFWEERQPRERTYIMLVGFFSIVAFIYAVAIDPALSGQEKLMKSLPVLQKQAVEMRHMAQLLKSLPSPENFHALTKNTLETSLSKGRLKSTSLSVSEGVVRLRLESISLAALQKWLLDVQKAFGLFVEEINITVLEDGLVQANIVLRQAGN